jgi:dolichol-phosphate mannosyltransferase
MKDVSVVVPVFNEEEVLDDFLKALFGVMNKTGKTFEVIVVDDGSTDKTAEIIKNSQAQGIFLKKNQGQEAAIRAGINKAEGKAIIVMDGDFQDPPELIPDLILTKEKGYDAVFARRTKRQDAWRLFSFFYYRLLKLFYPKTAPDCGNFFIADANLLKMLNSGYLRGRLATQAKNTGFVEFERSARKAGKTSYTFIKRLKLALSGLLLGRELK